MARIAFDIDGVLAHGLELRELNQGMDNEIYSGLEFASESLPLMDSLRDDRIYILTARNERLRGITEEWLCRNEFCYDGIFLSPYQDWRFAPRYKAEIVRKHEIEILVDDSSEIVDYVNRNTQCKAIMFTDWNQVCENIKLWR